MFKKTIVSALLILIGFSAGLGISHWEKVEIVNVIFYSGFAAVVLIVTILFCFEFWQGAHAYRQALAQQLDNFSKISITHVRPPALPNPEELHPDTETLDIVETMFYQVES